MPVRPSWQRRARVRDPCDIRIADQGQDWMVKRRRAQLDLARGPRLLCIWAALA